MSHLDDTLVMRYVSRGAPEAESLRVEEHIADCEACLMRVRALDYVRNNFDAAWASWTAAEHARLHCQWKLVLALSAIIESAPSLAENARRWLEDLGRHSVRGLNLLMDRTRGMAGVGPSLLPEGYGFRLEPATVGVGAPDTEATRHLQRSAELLSGGQGKDAARELAEARRIDARLPQAASSQVDRDGCRQAHIVVDARRGRAAVRYWPREGEPVPALVLLVPQDQPGEALAAELRDVEGEAFLLAEFRNAPEGQLELYW